MQANSTVLSPIACLGSTFPTPTVWLLADLSNGTTLDVTAVWLPCALDPWLPHMRCPYQAVTSAPAA